MNNLNLYVNKLLIILIFIWMRSEARDAQIKVVIEIGGKPKGLTGLQQDRTKAMEMYVRAGQLGCSKAHNQLVCFIMKGVI